MATAKRYVDLNNNPYDYTPQELMDLYDEYSSQSYFDPKRPMQLQTGASTSYSPGDSGNFSYQNPVYTDYEIVGIDTDGDGVEDRKTYVPKGRTPDTFLKDYTASKDYSAIDPDTGKSYASATTTPAATTPVGPDQSKIDAYTKKVSDAYQGAFGYGKNKISQLGYDETNDPYGLYSGLQSELSRITSTIPDTVEGPQYYSDDTTFDIPGAYKGVPSYVDQYITDTRTKTRKGYERQLTNKYGSDYGMATLPDTWDDTYINDLIEPQYQDALKQVETTRGRGLLDDTGYTNALGTLNKQKSAAVNNLTSFGNSYLNTGRNALNSSFGTEKNRATDWDYGDTFDLGASDTRLGSEATRQGDLIKSQLSSQAGSQSYFDPTAAIGTKRSTYGVSTGSGGSSDALMNQIGQQELRRTRTMTGAF